VHSVFSWAFVVLLADVVLVILYFILIRWAEVPQVGGKLKPSSWEESVMVAWILGGYFLWDVLTKAVISDDKPDTPPTFFGRFVSKTMWERGWISFVCMIGGIGAALFLNSSESPMGVVLVDLSLLFLVLLFRSLKARLWRLSGWLGAAAIISGVISKFLP
jgi:hypothetical protein